MEIYNCGDFIGTETIMIPVNAITNANPAASITVTNLANTDIYIYKDASLTQRASFLGIAVDIDVDGIAGSHWVTIDLSNNDDSGFYSTGSQFIVRMEGVTLDTGTINAWIGGFTIGKTKAAVTASLVAHNLDHLALTPTAAADMTTEVADDTILSRVLANGDTSAFVPSTDGMEPLRTLLDEIEAHVHELSHGTAGISTAPKASPNGFTITEGVAEANNEDSTHALDGTTHDIEDASPNTDVYYEFNVGTEGIPVDVSWHGFVNSAGDSVAFYGYDFGNTAWVQIGSIPGSPGTGVITENFTLTTNLVEVGVGTVRVRLFSTDATKIGTDQILVSYTAVLSSEGIVDEWESQSQADPTGFHVNVLEVAGTGQTANDNGADINSILDDTDLIDDATSGLAKIAADVAAILVDTDVIDDGTSGLVKIASDVAAVLVDTAELQTDDVPGLIAALTAALLLHNIQKNVAFTGFPVVMYLSSDHVTPAPGKTVTVQMSIDKGALAGVGGSMAEATQGLYHFDPAQADTNGTLITWRFTAADCDDRWFHFQTVT